MSVIRLGEVKAREGAEDALRARLEKLVPEIAGLEGCISCELLQSHAAPPTFVIIERWESLAAHAKAANEIPKDDIAEFMKLVDGRPRGDYYDSIAGG